MSKQNKFIDAIKDPFKLFAVVFRKLSPFIKNDALYLKILYFFEMRGKILHLKEPRYFTEKIQWLKLYGFKPEYTQLVDKLAVKDYVISRIGKEYVIPTLGVWDSVEDIDWDMLPRQFVLKTTHGGGSCGVVICANKRHFNRAKAIKKLKFSMRTNAGQTFREKPYIKVPRRIIAEKYMVEDKQRDSYKAADLPDYKFFCFAGEPYYCQVIRDRNSKETIDFYDMEWEHMPFVGLNINALNGSAPVDKPVNLETMKKICRRLSEGLKFSRIDLYLINEKVYFGEITFYPASGFGTFSPTEWNGRLGELIELNG